MKPNYMIIGAAKCATSTISTLLGRHPDVFMSDPKEPQFFSWEHVHALGLPWYESLFDAPAAAGKRMRGESSNTYTMRELYPAAAGRIAAYAPDLRLIYIVRNPIRRIESYWLEVRSHGGEDVHHDFNRAVVLNRDWLVDSSNYLRQIDVYRDHYPDDRIHIAFYEDFAEAPGDVLSGIFEFLGVDPDPSRLGDLGVHYGSTRDRRVTSAALSRMRALPGYRSAVGLVPVGLRRSLYRRVFSRPHRGRPRWEEGAHHWVLDQIGEDSRHFLQRCGRPADYWDLSLPIPR